MLLGEIKVRIKGYARLIDSSLVDDSYLDFIVETTINRALIYTNRLQLIAEEYEFEEDKPIPLVLESVLGEAVVGLYKTVKARVDTDTKEVKSLSDGSQSVSFGEQLASHLSSLPDADIFTGTKSMLDKFRLPTVV